MAQKQIKAITSTQAGTIPVDRLRSHLELLVPLIPIYFKDYDPYDQYRIFFATNEWKHRQRIYFYRRLLIYAIRSAFGTRVTLENLALVFKYETSSTVCNLTIKLDINNPQIELFKTSAIEILKERESHASAEVSGYVRISAFINKKAWVSFVPREYIDFADNLFSAFQLEPEFNLTQEEITFKGRKRKSVLARTIFIHLFLRKYPSVALTFIAWVLKRENSSTISTTIGVIYCYLSETTSKSDESIQFKALAEKIKTRCEAQRP
jgi:hypothetical protein